MKLTFGHSNQLTLGGYRIECNVTMRCNARCFGCNKGIGLVKFPPSESDMTVDQIRRAVDQLIEQKLKVTRFTFCGGEPVLNRDLQGMIYEVARLPDLHIGRVLTNDMPVTKSFRDKIKLPRRYKDGTTLEYTSGEGYPEPKKRVAMEFRWIPNPLDDPNDPYSGKNDPTGRYRGKVHTPFWISPSDIGMEANFQNCTTRGWCGIGLDSSGWSACGKMVMFGKLLGIDSAMREGDIVEHVSTPIEDICKHCQYGLETKVEMKSIANRYFDGELSAISPTFEKAFAQHKEQQLIQLEQF